MGKKGVVRTLVQAFLETGRSLKRQPVCQALRSGPLQSMGKRGREETLGGSSRMVEHQYP